MMRRPLRSAAVMAAMLAAGSAATAAPRTAAAAARPKLIVQLVIDQMRADYVDRYGAQWDLILLMGENFTLSTDAASHGTYYDYDRRVPVILFGSPFKAGKFEGPASPLDIAATWSRLTGVALDRPHGRSLDAAVK